jgi:hypothetical protein
MLRRWAEEKYHLPWTHSCIQEQTQLELLISFYEDYYHKNKIETHRTEDGEVMLETGDPVIDKWERELAQDLEPDLLDGMSDEYRKRFEDFQNMENVEEAMLEFNDDYTGIISNSGGVLGH